MIYSCLLMVRRKHGQDRDEKTGVDSRSLTVKWCLLPLAIAACFSMVDVSPAELSVDYYGVEEVNMIAR